MYQKYSKKYHLLFSGVDHARRFGDIPLFEPSNDDKLRLSKNAKAFVEASKTEPLSPDPTQGAVYGGLANLLNGIIRPLLGQVQRYPGWAAESWCLNCYDSSQTIKNNLTQALVNAETRLGSRDPKGVVAGPVEPVSIIKETVKELPNAVVEQAKENVAVVEAAIEEAAIAIEEATTAQETATQIEQERKQAEADALAAQDQTAKQEAEARKSALEAQLLEARKKADDARLKAEEQDRKLKAMGIDLAARKRKKLLLAGTAVGATLLILGVYFFYYR